MENKDKSNRWLAGLILLLLILAIESFWGIKLFNEKKHTSQTPGQAQVESAEIKAPQPQLDFAAYDKKLEQLANNPVVASSSTSTLATLWPVKAVYPNAGALLPFNRIVAYYGNL